MDEATFRKTKANVLRRVREAKEQAEALKVFAHLSYAYKGKSDNERRTAAYKVIKSFHDRENLYHHNENGVDNHVLGS